VNINFSLEKFDQLKYMKIVRVCTCACVLKCPYFGSIKTCEYFRQLAIAFIEVPTV